MLKLLFVFGTRPEVIKLAPLIHACLKTPSSFEVSICSSGQHQGLLNGIVDFFDLHIDYHLSVMTENQSLDDLTEAILKGLKLVLVQEQPDIIIIQGDTTTAFVAALAGFYQKIKICHVEAGLRTYDLNNPYPEEMNRRLISQLASYHFAPSARAEEALLKEGVLPGAIHVVGNTVVDALNFTLAHIESHDASDFSSFFTDLGICFDQRVVLITAHRRESFGACFDQLLQALLDLSIAFPAISFVFPLHPNPHVQTQARAVLSERSNLFLIEPLDYPYFVYLMKKASLILTDSGGIQEEAPVLGKSVFVFRDQTERLEPIDVGGSILMGRNRDQIFKLVSDFLNQDHLEVPSSYFSYGKGDSSDRIVSFLKSKIVASV